jgi:hypothetical protein
MDTTKQAPAPLRRATPSEGKQIRVTTETWEALRRARVEIIAEKGVLLDSYSDVILTLVNERPRT